MKRSRPARLTVLGLAVAVFAWPAALAFVDLCRHSNGPIRDPADFRAFYCAGAAIDRGADPYRTEPLRTCERKTAATFGTPMRAGAVLPAPLPPYALAPFALLARLPFLVASTSWFFLGIATLFVTAFLVRRLTGIPLGAVLATLFLSEAITSIMLGQVVPLILCALCAAGLALRLERPKLAAAMLGLAMIEPHVALPAAAASFFFVPRARLPLGVCAIALAGLSVVTVAPATAFEYVSRVLPLHARSELTALGTQFSLSTWLWAAGLEPGRAIDLGELSYALACACSVFVAGCAVRRFDDGAYAAIVPPAFAVIGGVFIHVTQMVVAVPLGLAMIAGGRQRLLAVAAVVCLAVPLEFFVTLRAVNHRFNAAPPPPPRAFALATEPRPAERDLAEAAEMADERSNFAGGDRRTTAEMILTKVPTWFGVVTIAGLTALAGRRRIPAAALPSA
jgi:hypothetical protein